MVIRSAVAGVAGVMMMLAAGSNPAAANGACGVGCDGAVNWTGFSIGVGIGGNADMIGHKYYETDNLGAYTAHGSDDSRGGDGFFGTVSLGYDWQFRDRFVLGAFTDFDFGRTEHNEKDSYDAGGGATGVAGWEMDRSRTWTIGARLGLLTSNTSMFYGLIGYSRTDMDIKLYDDNTVNSVSTSKSLDFSGLVLGAGLEHNLGGGFSLKGEYRYTNYGSEVFGVDLVNASATRLEDDTFDLDSHSFRLTVAYKFDRGERVEEVSYKDVAPAPAYTSRYK